MDFFSEPPSLTYLSHAEIALSIFYNPDVYNLVSNFHAYSMFPGRREREQRNPIKEIIDVVIDKLSTLESALSPPTYKSLRSKVRSLILNMAMELDAWKASVVGQIDYDRLKNIRPIWTKHSTIDRSKTAQKLIDSALFDPVVCFNLAKDNYLLDEALCLWSRMTEEQKAAGSEFGDIFYKWLTEIEFEESPADTKSFLTFLEQIHFRLNENLIRLILSTKSPEERKEYLRAVIRNRRQFDCFSDRAKLEFLFQIGEEWLEVLREEPLKTLLSFLERPFVSKFLQVADMVWSYLTPRDFFFIFEKAISSLELMTWQNFEIMEVLQEFWNKSPENFKDYMKRCFAFTKLKILLECSSLESLDFKVLDGTSDHLYDYSLLIMDGDV